MSKDELQAFFKFLDVNKDGKISFDEIYEGTIRMVDQQNTKPDKNIVGSTNKHEKLKGADP
jgi:Ca2+-binding EF-hand superfamily protein